MKNKKCKHEGCTNPVWSSGLCQNHIVRKPIKKTNKWNVYTSELRGKKKRIDIGKSINKKRRYDLFMVLWKKRGPRSEVSGEKIFGEPSSAHFHHILPKNKYPEADLDPENIVIMTMDEHNNVENDMYKYALINERRLILMKKYDLI